MARFGSAFVLIVLALLVAFPPSARAAESYDNCTGFITSLPATISTQGTWCFNKDMNTAISSGSAISINTNNVTIDCNFYKLGGLTAGTGTQTVGIYANARLNITVRHCNIRGFVDGIYFPGSGGGHTIEDNQLSGNTQQGIIVVGDGSVIRRNQIRDTGGSTAALYLGSAYGINTVNNVDILDNTVDGLAPVADGIGNASVYGIYTNSSSAASVSGNRIRGLLPLGNGLATGIFQDISGNVTLRDNDVVGPGAGGNSLGLACANTAGTAIGNVVSAFSLGILNCTDSGGNVVK